MRKRPTQRGEALLFAGTAQPALGAAVARSIGRALGRATIERYPDAEISLLIDESVRGRDVFFLESTSPSVNDHLMELLVFADACRRADALRVTAIVPYFGYARADKRQGRRAPITARAVADLMQSMGIARVVMLDVHTPQVEGFFHIPVDNLSAVPLLADALRERLAADAVIVSPDLGGVHLATRYSEMLGRPTAVCVKRRAGRGDVSVSQVIGDVRGRPCVIVDDMITTGGTIAACAGALVAAGAHDGFAVAATHGVLVPGARERLHAAHVVELLVSDSVAVPECGEVPLRQVSVAPLLAEVVRRLAGGRSLRDLC